MVLLLAACTRSAPTATDLALNAERDTDPTPDAEVVWSTFAARVEAATAIRLYYKDRHIGKSAMLTLHRDGRVARDWPNSGTCRTLVTEGQIRWPCSGSFAEREEIRPGGAEIQSGLAALLPNLSQVPHEIRAYGNWGVSIPSARSTSTSRPGKT